MTTEEKAQALVDAVRSEYPFLGDFNTVGIALSRAIEQHEAFRQEVSDAVMQAFLNTGLMPDCLGELIIPAPKPDPLVYVLLEMDLSRDLQECQHDAIEIRKALDRLGFEIREKSNEN